MRKREPGEAKRFATVLAASLIVLAGLWSSCATADRRSGESPPADWLAWQQRRLTSVAGPAGWTTLIGLHWLREGANTAGRDPAHDVVIASEQLPRNIGTFTRTGTNVLFTAAPGARVTLAGAPIHSIQLTNDSTLHPTRLEIGQISIIAIQRGERLGLRIRNSQAKTRREFKGISLFPYDPKWRLAGRFVPYPEPRKMRVPDVTGSLQEFPSPGEIVFRVNGTEARLAVALEPDEPDFFILFHDQTAGSSTYPSGRFLYVSPPPAGDDRVTIDFNRAYTPPCGFTPFATCPIPPKQNWLPFPIEAGERKPPGHP